MFSFFLLLLAFISCVANAEPFSLSERLSHAAAGDYIVTEQDKNLSLLVVRSINGPKIVLEEITLPTQQHPPSWKEWARGKAPGHTSWMLYEIDFEKKELVECFSVSKNGWVPLSSADHFFTRLAGLSFKSVPEQLKRKIGPPPAFGENDHRRLWNPPLVIEGKKIAKPSFDVWQGKWPKDDSPLSECRIDLYFSQELPHFPFPHWIEAYNGHYTYKVRVKDSGSGMHTAFSGPMPKRVPEFIGKTQTKDQGMLVHIKAPLYYTHFQLFAVESGAHSSPAIPIPCVYERLGDASIVQIHVSKDHLKNNLQPGHRYRWALLPDQAPEAYVESEDVFKIPETIGN